MGYSKAPRAPFPAALHDLEAVYLAAAADASLPVDRRVAVLGFSAGANLALAMCQLPSIRNHGARPPTAAVSVYGVLDAARDPRLKAANRPYKATLPAPMGAAVDALAGLYDGFMWSYVPYGHDLRDPLLSPAHARRADLPPHVCVVAAELDMLAHEGWRLACRLAADGAVARGDGRGARRRVPDGDSADAAERVCGREAPAGRRGALEEDGGDERFGFEVCWAEGEGEGDGSVKWLLVPDQVHGFDNVHMRALLGGGEESVRDMELKTVAYVGAVGEWLRGTVWKM